MSTDFPGRAGMPVALVIAVVVTVAGCKKKPTAPRDAPRNGVVLSSDDSSAELIRELEATVLENYSQLTLGNYDAYMGAIARDVDIVLVSIGATDLYAGTKAPPSWVQHLPYYGRGGVRLYSRDLRVSLSRDEQVGWISDEISYRVPISMTLAGGATVERIASIPIRVTAAYVRDVDRWVTVTEQLSYALPAADIIAMARSKQLHKLSKLPREGDIDERTADSIAAVVERFYESGSEGASSLLADGAVVLTPTPYSAADDSTDHFDRLFHATTRVQVVSTRVSARIGKTAWMVANLRAIVGSEGDRTIVPMRGTFLLEARRDGDSWRWEIVQAHVAVPLEQKQLDQRVFGDEPSQRTEQTEHMHSARETAKRPGAVPAAR